MQGTLLSELSQAGAMSSLFGGEQVSVQCPPLGALAIHVHVATPSERMVQYAPAAHSRMTVVQQSGPERSQLSTSRSRPKVSGTSPADGGRTGSEGT